MKRDSAETKLNVLKVGTSSEMFQTWEDVFQSIQDTELHETRGHVWTLNINNTLDELTLSQKQQRWKMYTTSSLAKFTCSSCRHCWHSARVSLLFHYRLVGSTSGEVRLRLFRQECRRCQNDNMLTASFEEDKKREVLMRLINKIKKNCYGEYIETVNYSRGSEITKPHEASLCEACKMGKCNKEN